MLQSVKLNFISRPQSINNNPLSELTPDFFLQTFILELMHASEQQGQKHCEQLIEHIAQTEDAFLKKLIEKILIKMNSSIMKAIPNSYSASKTISVENFHWFPVTRTVLPLPIPAVLSANKSPTFPNYAG